MKAHIQKTITFAVLAGVVCLSILSVAHAQTYTWDQQALGQLYLTCPGPVTFNYYWPNNNNWTQTYQTNGNCNGTAIVTSAPSNWDPTPPLGLYPGGPGLQGVNVIIGGLVNGTNMTGGATTVLNSANVTVNNLTIQTNGSLSFNYGIALNRIEFQGDGVLNGGVITIGNGGAMLKSGGTNSYSLTGDVYGTNITFEVDSGTLIWPTGFGNVNLVGGTFAVSNNATLVLTADSGATPMFTGNFTGGGGGTVLFNNGALMGGWSLNLPGNMFQWTGGTLEGTSTNAGVFNLTNSLGFHGARFYNNNLVNMANNSSLNCSSTGGAIYNNAGATFNIQGNSSLLNGGLFGFNNYGLLQKSAGAGTAQITMVLNNYGGTVEVDAGTMALNGIYLTNATFVVSNGATLDLATVTGNFEIEGSLTGSGGGTVLMNNGTVSSSYPTTFNFPGSMFQWAGGKLGDTYNNTETNLGTLNVSGQVGISGYFANSGMMIQSGNGAITGGNQLQNNASGIYNIQNDNGVSPNTFNNFGLFEKTSGTGTSIIGGTFNNSGSIQASSGVLLFTNGTFVQNAGTLQLSPSLLCQDTLHVNGGTVTGEGAVGNPGIDVSVAVNGGVLAPGNPFGTLTSGGHYGFSMGSAATLSVALGGDTQFGQLAVIGGSANLNGKLAVTLANGYSPPIGTQFQIISGNRGSSTFSTLNVPHGISVTYSNTGVYLTVTSAVPPQVMSPQLAGGNFTFGFGTVNGQSYTVQQNPDLTTTNWTFYTNITGDGSLYQFLTPVTNSPQLFFRVREP